MIYERYGQSDSDFGWEIDHIYPQKKLKDAGVPQELIDNIKNLRPLNSANNKSKGTDYPVYRASRTAEDDHNIPTEDEKVVNESVQKSIAELFRDYSL